MTNLNNFLTNIINKTINGNGDSDQHFLTLFSLVLSSKSKTVIELGVREGGTTLPLLSAVNITDGVLYSIDINETNFIPPKEFSKNWSFYKEDAIDFLKKWDMTKQIDLIYIDDWHSYNHVKKELEIIDKIVSPSTIVLIHDLMYGNTCPFYHCDLTNNAGEQWADGGPYRAVAELNPQFWEFATLPYNNGLTLLRKKYSSLYKNR